MQKIDTHLIVSFEKRLHQLSFMVRLANAGVAQLTKSDLAELTEELERLSVCLEKSWIDLEDSRFLQAQGGRDHD